MKDTRPEIAPDQFSFRDLPKDGNTHPIVKEVAEKFREWGVAEMRATIVSYEYPNEPYPHGLYFEGWSKAPHTYDPPGKQAPFNYPLTETTNDRA